MIFDVIQFPSAIAAAWTLHGRKLSELSLLNGHDFPALEELSFERTCDSSNVHSSPDDADTDVMGPLLYIGVYFITLLLYLKNVSLLLPCSDFLG
jgi:hypothetical protein